MKTTFLLNAAVICALCALSFVAAPVPPAAAQNGDSHHADPCHYTRAHDADNQDFQMWEEFCDDAVRELRARKATADAMCTSVARRANRDFLRACARYCNQCAGSRPNDPDCRRLSAQIGSAISRGLRLVSKCTWDAQTDYDAIYESARAQLESAGYTCLIQKLYTEYRYVQRETIQFERQARFLVIGPGCICM